VPLRRDVAGLQLSNMGTPPWKRAFYDFDAQVSSVETGVSGGVAGGVPGGVLGGVVGGTGDIPAPVMDYDRPPRLLRQTKPEYPQDAFVRKIEGVVVVEILIDATGRVARVRVVRSVPLLDAAALAAVRQWVFEPAIKKGRPVATVAVAPVSFRIL
jgi:protein TonB